MNYLDKAYMTKADLLRAYTNGHIDIIYKQLIRYGTITYDYMAERKTGYYKGCRRLLKITHKGIDWNATMQDGNVVSVGYKY